MAWIKFRDYINSSKNTQTGSSTFTIKYKLKPMKQHTNLTNEIDGSTHYMKSDRFFDGFSWKVALGTVAMIVGAGVIYLLAF